MPPRRDFPPEIMAEIVKLYESNHSLEKLGSQFKIAPSTIKRRLIEQGIEIKDAKPYAQFSEEDIQLVEELYSDGYSARKISKLVGISAPHAARLLARRGNKMRGIQETNRKHSVNHNFFDVIDTEEKAYFLGFLFADGNVHKKDNSISLKLHKKDREILVKFSMALMNKEHLYSSEENLVVKVCSQNMKEKLCDLGCVPNKSLVLKFPTLEEQWQRHFIRGYLDGDGCITKSKKKKNFRVMIMSTQSFNDSIAEIVKKAINIDGRVSNIASMMKRGNFTTTNYLLGGNRKVEQFLDWLYEGATIYLARKHAAYLDLKARIAEIDQKPECAYLKLRQISATQ